jgi:hypothetical protein
MRTVAIRLAIAVGLMALGWGAHAAQVTTPEFTIEIDAPLGHTTIVCVKGCLLQGLRDQGNPINIPTQKYSFECSGGAVQRCRARTNGWLQR